MNNTNQTTTCQRSQPSRPGLLEVSPAMLAEANQTQSKSRRNKGTSQRRSQNASSTNLNAASLDKVETPASTPSGQADRPVSTLTAALAEHRSADTAAITLSPNTSPVKRSRRRRQPKTAQSNSEGDEGEDPVESSQLPATEDVTLSSISPSKLRPRNRRGTSSLNPGLTTNDQDDSINASQLQDEQSHIPGVADSTAILSKSAPSPSHLESSRLNKKRMDKQQQQQANNSSNVSSTKKDVINDKHRPNIRGSNSADEWDMPSARQSIASDALTWQQQAVLSRKPSQQSKRGSKAVTEVTACKKQTVANTQQAASPIPASAPSSGVSNAPLATTSVQATPQASPALTWQQALLQRSAPATPSSLSIFEALEEGHSGARPAPSDHARTRSSPGKVSRPYTTRSQQDVSTLPASSDDKDEQLEYKLSSLDLVGSKPATKVQTKPAKKVKQPLTDPAIISSERKPVVQQPQQGTRGANMATTTAVQPIAIPPSSASPSKSMLYAGPKFLNSPAARQLPTPKFATYLNRNRDSSPVSTPPASEPIFA